MAHDLFFKNTKRDWSRDNTAGSSTGYDQNARAIFERRSCTEQPAIVVKSEPSHVGWLGTTVGVMFATRILSGKWPWYWAGLAAKRLEGSHSPQKG